ncbi:Triosephosphate isomerase [hydrothermal vent metagenome]|uniref:triose-phosphate isomerase n=1 Tax=hydrothermal vent metagenome TaxID=652676 RepID=A0A3B0VLZ8_9ZZZZ
MKRRPLIAGNWKMHLDSVKARQLAQDLIPAAAARAGNCDVMIAPSPTLLPVVSEAIKDSVIILGAQNVCWATQGAFTGETSPAMLLELGCRMAIIGHSERRHIFAEDDRLINKRLSGALEHGLIPILCLGETLEARQQDQTFKVLEGQLRSALINISIKNPAKLIIAYEPVWAIGTGQTATTEQAQEVHVFLRQLIGDIFDKTIASGIRILYGGSVKPETMAALMSQEDIDGVLVGGAALDAESFSKIINYS